MDPSFNAKYAALLDRLKGYGQVMVAFSGGVDSLLLLHAAVEALGTEKVEAVIGISPTLPGSELEEARRLAGEIGLRLRNVDTGVMRDEKFISNPEDRCYHCRLNLTETLKFIRKGAEGNSGPEGIGERTVLLDGANADDLWDYRPGLQASSEHGVVHPLIDAGITKQDVRDILRCLGYSEKLYTKPAAPCLSSRIPYGEEITLDKLKRIEKSEDLLKALGIREVRVRHLETSLGETAVIELKSGDIDKLGEETRSKIVAGLKRFGFKRVLLNLEGFRSGNLNDVIKMEGKRIMMEEDEGS